MDSITNLAKLFILSAYQNEDTLYCYNYHSIRWIDEFIKWLRKEKQGIFSEVIKFCEENDTEPEDVLLFQPSPDSKPESDFLLCWAEWILADEGRMRELGEEMYDYMYWKNEEPADFYGWVNTKPWAAIQMPRSPEEVVKICKEFWPEKNWKTGHKILYVW